MVRIFYPFHPHAGSDLQVISRSRRMDGTLTVRGGDALDLKVPCWMLLPAAGEVVQSDNPTVDIAALRALVMLANVCVAVLTPEPLPEGNEGTDETNETADVRNRTKTDARRSRSNGERTERAVDRSDGRSDESRFARQPEKTQPKQRIKARTTVTAGRQP